MNPVPPSSFPPREATRNAPVVPSRSLVLTISPTLRSFLYHVKVASGLPAVAVHMSFSTVPATIVVPSSYPVTLSFDGGSEKSQRVRSLRGLCIHFRPTSRHKRRHRWPEMKGREGGRGRGRIPCILRGACWWVRSTGCDKKRKRKKG